VSHERFDALDREAKARGISLPELVRRKIDREDALPPKPQPPPGYRLVNWASERTYVEALAQLENLRRTVARRRRAPVFEPISECAVTKLQKLRDPTSAIPVDRASRHYSPQEVNDDDRRVFEVSELARLERESARNEGIPAILRALSRDASTRSASPNVRPHRIRRSHGPGRSV
jgi:hypothetical protein